MMIDWVSIIQFSLPSGFLGFSISWFVNRRVTKARQFEEIEFAYKHLYLSLKKEVAAINNELLLLKSQIRDADSCPHYSSNCPLYSGVKQIEDYGEN